MVDHHLDLLVDGRGNYGYKYYVNISSTNNVTGVYGMGASGGEMMADYFEDTYTDKHKNYADLQAVLADGGSVSTAYRTIYKKFDPNDESTSRKGDAIFEISSKGEKLQLNRWFAF